MKYWSLLALSLFLGCQQFQHQRTWEEVESRLAEINRRYERSQFDIENIAESEKEKLLRLDPEEFERVLQDLRRQQAADNARLEELYEAQVEKVRLFEEVVEPLLGQAKSKEEYHRIVVEYADYCDEYMVESSRTWLKLNVAAKE